MKAKGFTLIELLLVFAIIGICCAIAIPALTSQLHHPKNSASPVLEVPREPIQNDLSKVGCTKAQILKSLGAPDKKEVVEKLDVWYYSIKGDKLVLTFENGKCIASRQGGRIQNDCH